MPVVWRYCVVISTVLSEFRSGIRRSDRRKCSTSSNYRRWHCAEDINWILEETDVEELNIWTLGNEWMFLMYAISPASRRVLVTNHVHDHTWYFLVVFQQLGRYQDHFDSRRTAVKLSRRHRRRKRGVCRGSDTPTICVEGISICISPLEKPNTVPSHANCMQHVLRC